jgi:hypothetical protein
MNLLTAMCLNAHGKQCIVKELWRFPNLPFVKGLLGKDSAFCSEAYICCTFIYIKGSYGVMAVHGD